MKREVKWCDCGKVGGKYVNDIDACYWGNDAIPLGFANDSFVEAVKNQPESGMGKRFIAFVIPKKCPTFIKCKKP